MTFPKSGDNHHLAMCDFISNVPTCILAPGALPPGRHKPAPGRISGAPAADENASERVAGDRPLRLANKPLFYVAFVVGNSKHITFKESLLYFHPLGET